MRHLSLVNSEYKIRGVYYSENPRTPRQKSQKSPDEMPRKIRSPFKSLNKPLKFENPKMRQKVETSNLSKYSKNLRPKSC